LSESDIQRMVKDAEAHAGEDKKKRELVEARNQAEALIHSTQKNLAEHGDKVPPPDKAAIEGAVEALKAVTGAEDVAEIKAKTEALAQAAMKLGEAMYKAQQAEAAGGAQGGPQGGPGGPAGGEAGGAQPGGQDEKVVDADFEEVKDGNKKA
jgi:molecular chaperone DnaK